MLVPETQGRTEVVFVSERPIAMVLTVIVEPVWSRWRAPGPREAEAGNKVGKTGQTAVTCRSISGLFFESF